MLPRLPSQSVVDVCHKVSRVTAKELRVNYLEFTSFSGRALVRYLRHQLAIVTKRGDDSERSVRVLTPPKNKTSFISSYRGFELHLRSKNLVVGSLLPEKHGWSFGTSQVVAVSVEPQGAGSFCKTVTLLDRCSWDWSTMPMFDSVQ